MAIKTNNYSKSGSYSKPSTTTKAKTSSKSNSTAKNSSSTSKSTVNSSQKRDTFTSSSAKVQKTSKTTQNAKTSSSKSSNSSKTTVKSTSTVNNSSKTAASSKNSVQSKSNRDTFTYSSQTTATKSKTTSTASKTSSKTNAKNQTTSGSSNRDTFSCSAKMENLTRITKTSASTTQKSNSVKNSTTSVSNNVVKSTVNTAKQGAAVGINATKNNTQTKSTPTKNNNTVTNKLATASSKSKILESIQKQYEHTNKNEYESYVYSGDGPFKLDISTKDDIKKVSKVYCIPYCSNKVEITTGNVNFFKPDEKSKFGYVEYANEKYDIKYNELEEGKQVIGAIYTEIKHLQLPNSGLKFDWLSGFTDTTLEDIPSRSFKDKSGKILQSNSKNPQNEEFSFDNHSIYNILTNASLNTLGFVQNSLKRDNFDVICMENNCGDKFACITYSQNYLSVKKDGILGYCTTPIRLFAVNQNGELYDINNSSN